MEEFDLNKCKKILHIGCGAYPVTALILSQLDNVKIVTIDKSHRSIEMAKEIIKKKDLENKIFAEQADGAIYPIDGFDTIIVSGCSTPKIPIYRNVIKNAKPYCKIIIRDEYLDVKSIVTDILPDMDLKITKKMENHAFTTSRWTSYCIQKNS
jgi:predicted O-methyltransferase YrrM